MLKDIKESSSIQAHINNLQAIITRMATNSANCKTWLITITSAIIVLLINNSMKDYLYITYLPILIFWILDVFYLGLEKSFREVYNDFIDELEDGDYDYKSVFRIRMPVFFNRVLNILKALVSFSTTPLYAGIGLLIFIIWKII